MMEHGSACGPVIVPVFKSQKELRINGLRTITARIAHGNAGVLHLRASKRASKFSTCEG
jgi:hypothetical protein